MLANRRTRMIPKNAHRFSEKIMRKHEETP
jgi:hypothetical protein